MKRNILEAAKVIRSKNSGPYELTLDIMFKDREFYELFKKRRIINAALISRLYRVPKSDILRVVYFEPSHAVKVTLRRRIPSGAPGETDIYGAQQHAPLFDITF
ncbi:MAG: DUF4387 domain-containing protein [Candidatus Aminicenantales bacterium]|jgi:hypothetical protein